MRFSAVGFCETEYRIPGARERIWSRFCGEKARPRGTEGRTIWQEGGTRRLEKYSKNDNFYRSETCQGAERRVEGRAVISLASVFEKIGSKKRRGLLLRGKGDKQKKREEKGGDPRPSARSPGVEKAEFKWGHCTANTHSKRDDHGGANE